MYFEDIEIGSKVLVPERRVEEEEMLDFARKYNGSLMHVNEEFASRSRMGRITASGMFTYLLMWGYYAPRNFGAEHEIAGMTASMEFLAPVFAGDRLHAEVIVVDKKERNPYNGMIFVEMNVYNQDNIVVLRAKGDDVIQRRP